MIIWIVVGLALFAILLFILYFIYSYFPSTGDRILNKIKEWSGMPIEDMSLMLHLDEGPGWGDEDDTELGDSSNWGNTVKIKEAPPVTAGPDVTWMPLNEQQPWLDEVMFGDSALKLESSRGGYIEAEDNDILDVDAITMEVWIRLDSTTPVDCDANNNWRYILRRDMYYYLQLRENRQIFAEFRVGGLPRSLLSTSQIPEDEYVFIAATYDNETGKGRLFINQDMEAEQDWATGNIDDSSGFPLTIGVPVKSPCPVGGIPDAVIDEVRIYNRACSSREVVMHYQGLF